MCVGVRERERECVCVGGGGGGARNSFPTSSHISQRLYYTTTVIFSKMPTVFFEFGEPLVRVYVPSLFIPSEPRGTRS